MGFRDSRLKTSITGESDEGVSNLVSDCTPSVSPDYFS